MTRHIRFFSAGARAAICIALTAGALYLAVQPDGRAADKSDPPKAAAGPLDYVPADAAMVISVRVADLWGCPLAKAGRNALGKDLADDLDKVRKQFGVAPDEIERLTLFYTPGAVASGPPMMVVTTVKPYDRKAVLDAAAPGAKEEKINNRSVYLSERGRPSFAFLDDHTFFVHGDSDSLATWVGQRPSGIMDGGPGADLKLAAEKHHLVAWVNIAALAKGGLAILTDDHLPPSLQPFKPLQKAQLATLTVDLDEQLRADLKVTFAGEADAKEGTAALNDALDMARAGLAQVIEGPNRLPDAPKITAILKDAQAALRAAKAEQKGSTAEVTAALKIDPDAASAALTEAVQKVRDAAKRIQISNDLKQLALAVHSYHDANGRFPADAIYDKNGKPLLSWRVMLLPYLEQNELYKQFHLDEPWDSEHNKKLLEKMPAVFAPPDSQAFKDHETFFQCFVGKGSVFGDKDARPTMSLITAMNGASNTIMFVEAKKSVPWSKPEDVPFDEGKLVPKLGGLSKDGFLVAFCDGAVRFLPLTVDEKALHLAVQYANATPFTLDP